MRPVWNPEANDRLSGGIGHVTAIHIQVLVRGSGAVAPHLSVV
jgi:hypothetical protein